MKGKSMHCAKGLLKLISILSGWEYENENKVIIKVNGEPIVGTYDMHFADTPGAEQHL